jgi:Zn-dependent alcohol dehydrogenase
MGGLSMKRDLPRYVRLIEKGLFDAKSIATKTYPLDQTLEAFQVTADRTTVAAVVVFG